MKKFVAIYLGSAEGLAEWKATDDEKRKEREKAGMEGWMKWATDCAEVRFWARTIAKRF